MRFDEGAFEDIIEHFHEAAALPELWPDALHAAALATGCEGGTIVPFPNPSAMPFSRGIAEVVDTFTHGGWHARNPRAQRGLMMFNRNPGAGRYIYTDTDLLSPDEIKRDPFYQDFLAPLGFGSHFSALLAENEGQFAFISFERRASSDPYSAREIERLNKLFDRLRVAGSLAARIGLSAADKTVGVFDRIGCAAALFDARRRLVRANASFERLLGDGLHLRRRQLIAADGNANTALARLMAAAAESLDKVAALGKVVIARPSGRLPLIVEAVPVAGAANDVFSFARVVLMIRDPEDRAESDPDLLRRIFRLTPAEARLAVKLGAGTSLEEAADMLGITRGTARVQLKSVFAKTDTHRQGELVARLSNLAKKPPL